MCRHLDDLGVRRAGRGVRLHRRATCEWFTVNAMKSAFLPFDERLALIADVIKPAYAELQGEGSSTP